MESVGNSETVHNIISHKTVLRDMRVYLQTDKRTKSCTRVDRYITVRYNFVQ